MAFDEKGAKRKAALSALEFVKGGMCVGLGTGSTAALFIEGLGEKAKKEKLAVTCVCTSRASEALAKKCGLKIIPLAKASRIDIAIDGADQIDRRRNLIKGYGGALAREKVVDYAADKFIVIADSRKMSEQLDKPVPVEALPFCEGKIENDLSALGAKGAKLRLNADGEPFISDNHLYIWDADFGKISDPAGLERRIKGIPGVLECGLFTNPVWKVIVAGEKGVFEA